MIPVEDVLFFISDEKYTRVQTATLEALIRKPIKELVDELDADVFWQIHRSTLVNTRVIAGVSRDLRGRQLVAVKRPPGKARGEPQLRGAVQGHVDAPAERIARPPLSQRLDQQVGVDAERGETGDAGGQAEARSARSASQYSHQRCVSAVTASRAMAIASERVG